MSRFDFAQSVLNWYQQHGRKDLPWQRSRSLYRVWISEIMLQQTQVTTVIPYFERFMQRFPTVTVLAGASDDEVLHHWSGLGYYARARNLHQAAKQIIMDHGGDFPDEFDSVLALPGIGRSTAGAILAQALGQRHAILDGNVKRLLARFHGVQGWPGQNSVQRELWRYAETHTPEQQLADYTQGMMDLGATLCRRRKPSCERCPLAAECVALRAGRVTELPTSKPKQNRPVRAARMLILIDSNQQVLLEKRPPSGIWGGLWSLPELALETDVTDWCTQRLRLKVGAIEDGATFRHSFSHYHLDITPCRVQVKNPGQSVMEAEGIVWYNTSHPDRRGLAAPVKNILEAIL